MPYYEGGKAYCPFNCGRRMNKGEEKEKNCCGGNCGCEA